MLNAATLKRLAELAGVKEDDLKNAIAAEQETDLGIDSGRTAYSDEELNTLKTNQHNDSKKTGVEIAVKEAREKLGLSFQGKTIEGLLEAHVKKVLEEAKLDPNEQVKELQGKVATLQNTIQEQEQQLTKKAQEVDSVLSDHETSRFIPAFGEEGPAFEPSDVLQMMRGNGYSWKRENGTVRYYKDGQLLQDKLGNPLPGKDVVTEFMKGKRLLPAESIVPSGRGGGNQQPTGRPSKLSELKEQFKAQGKNTQGQEFMQAAEQAKKEDPNFDLNA